MNDEVQKRDKTLLIRLTKTEYEKIKQNADYEQLQTAVYIRQKALNQTIKRKHEIPKIDKNLLLALARIGNNINQIAKQLNSNQSIEATNCLLQLAKISEQLDNLEKQYTAKESVKDDS